MKKAFTLMELAIVLVVISFIVVSVTAGQKLVKDAKLQKVITEIKALENAFYGFKNIYSALPGDLDTAGSFWGLDCDGASSGSNTCSGNGDGDIDTSGNNDWQEAIRSTYHLKKSGLIFDQISGEGDPMGSGRPGFVPGTNIPASSWPAAGYSVWGTIGGSASRAHPAILWVGETVSTSWNFNPTFLPEEAKKVDVKLDDGMPLTGKVLNGNSDNNILAAVYNNADNCVDDSTLKYIVTYKSKACGLAYVLQKD